MNYKNNNLMKFINFFNNLYLLFKMGECMSICGSKNFEEENPNPINKEPIKVIDVHAPSNQTINSNASHPSIIKRTKKNKTRIPKNVMFKDEEEIIYPNKEREKSMIRFEEMSDERIEKNILSDEEKSEDKDDNFHDYKKNIEKEEEIQNQEKVDKNVEIINTDIHKNLQETGLSENKSKESELIKDELIIDNKNNSLKKEKNDNIQNSDNQINNNENKIVEMTKEEKVKNDEEENSEINEKININDKGDEKIRIKEENKDKEEEKKPQIKEEEKEKEKFINNGNQKEVIISKEEDINENKINLEKNCNINNNEILRSKQNKKEKIIENKKQQAIKEEKNEEKGVEKENEQKDAKKEEDIIEENILNSEKKKSINNGERIKEKELNKIENVETNISSEKNKVGGEEEEEEEEENNEREEDDNQKLNFLENYKSLIEIININLEVNGLGKLSVKNRIDDLYKSLSDLELSENLISRLFDLLIELMNISQNSDKIILKDFCKDLIVLYNGDKNKIYKQIMEFIEGIDEQEKLTTRKSNRIIRTYIQDSKDKLKKRLREEDIPSDKIISYELFNKIVEECEIKLKEEHMDVLLYQMKKAVPKGRNFNTLNAIVILDFLK